MKTCISAQCECLCARERVWRKTFNMLCAFAANLLLLKALQSNWDDGLLNVVRTHNALVFMRIPRFVMCVYILWGWSRLSGKFGVMA